MQHNDWLQGITYDATTMALRTDTWIFHRP